MFVYIYVDILGFYKPGVIEDILAGRVWQLEINQTWALGALVLMMIPILMVFLSLALPARANRITNIIVASLYVVVSVGNAVGEPWVYYFAVAVLVEVAVLALVIRYSWMWPRTDLQM
jgi:multisubunit Na+/H+ antiporter MnhB subunit